MAAKSKAAPKAAEPTTTEKAVASDAPLASNPDPNAITGDMLPADREVLQGTLEERGAALDADLQRMGARPKD